MHTPGRREADRRRRVEGRPEEPGSKLEKAKALRIPVWDEAELLRRLKAGS